MKKVISFILSAVLLLSAVACSGGTPTDAPADESSVSDTPATIEIPERGKADRSNLAYVSAIDKYLKSDWAGYWIWTKSCSEDSYVSFRKTVTVSADETATAYISSVDKYVLFLNGEMVVLDGSVKRGPTPYDTYYDTVSLNLKSGDNEIAVLVAFNGRSGDGSIVPVMANSDGDMDPQAGFLFEMDCSAGKIVSDTSWKCARNAGYKNRATGGKDYVRYDQSSMLAERNVFYNAADSMGDWTALGYDDSAWEDATIIAKPGDLPFGDIYDAMIKTPKFGDLVDFESEYIGASLAADTTLELHLPGNMQFTWYIELESDAGKALTFYTNTYTDRQGMQNFKDTYLTASGAQSYENYPWRSGSVLYVEAPAGVKFNRIAYRPSGASGEWVGSFTSSDAVLTQLWQESLNTIAICMRDTFMDCPERERGPYMGDAANEIDATLYAYDGEGLEITKKAILACIGWTLTDGAIPSRAPSQKPQEIPNQSLSFMTTAYHYWLHSGDADTMNAYYDAFVNYLKLYETGDNGLPLYRDGSWTWNDWGNNIDTELLQSAWYYYALTVTEKLASDLGREFDPELKARMTSYEGAWHDYYYTADGFKAPESRFIDDRANALLVLGGLITDENDKELVTNVLDTTYEASPYMEKFVLEALCKLNKQDLAIKRIKARYGLMVTDSWDTLYEQFNDEIGTYNHGWTSAPLYILSKYVAGIRPVKAGWEEYEIVLSDALEDYTCTEWTPKGAITVEKTGESVKITAIDTKGTIVLPNGEVHEIEGAGTYEF